MVTPIELVNYIAAIANGGILYRPRISADLPVTVLADISDAIADNLPEVQSGMIDAVERPYGTAWSLADLPISVAAKTGSAEVGSYKMNAIFVGYSPAENSQIVIFVLIENAREGSLNAVPVARDVLLWYYTNRIQGISL